MHPLYVDESGNPDGAEDKYFVLGGVAVFEREVYWINEQVNAIASKYFPTPKSNFTHRQSPPIERSRGIRVRRSNGIKSSMNCVQYHIFAPRDVVWNCA